MAATKMSRAKTQRRKEIFLFFTVKIRVTPETDLRVAPGLVEAGQKVGYGFM
jgi:hypothetical protein